MLVFPSLHTFSLFYGIKCKIFKGEDEERKMGEKVTFVDLLHASRGTRL